MLFFCYLIFNFLFIYLKTKKNFDSNIIVVLGLMQVVLLCTVSILVVLYLFNLIITISKIHVREYKSLEFESEVDKFEYWLQSSYIISVFILILSLMLTVIIMLQSTFSFQGLLKGFMSISIALIPQLIMVVCAIAIIFLSAVLIWNICSYIKYTVTHKGSNRIDQMR